MASFIGSKKKPTTVAVVLVLIVASISSVLIWSSLQSHEVKHGGTPIDETRFAELADSEPGPAMLPGGPLVVSPNAVRLTLDYSVLVPIITLNESIDIALQFYSEFSYLSGLNFTPDPVWNNHDIEYYTLRFFHDGTELYTVVSSITGMIQSFSPSRSLLSPFEKTPQTAQLLSEEDVEEKVFGFLNEHNYTFSPHTRYEGPTLMDELIFVGFWVYKLHFFCVINGSKVVGNWCTLELDIETGEILRFSYRWFVIPSLPIDGIISAKQAEQNTLAFFINDKNAKGLYVTKTQLWFKTVGVYPKREYWLCWIVDMEHQNYAGAIINAKGGWVLDCIYYAF
ncbi:MAG: hypothetical protein ACXABY_27295 [Candidatus Thorarchaeota archaeon]|jgi:hypothetical protein